jgi:hypothetical protein
VIGVDRAGDATVVWLQHGRGPGYAVEVSVRPAGERFRAPVVLANIRVSSCCGTSHGVPGVLAEGNSFGIGPALAVAADGASVVAWQDAVSMQAAERPAGACPAEALRACFLATQTLPAGLQPRVVPPEQPGARPKIVFGARDTAYLVWAGPDGLELAVAAAHHRFAASRIASGTDTFTALTIALTAGTAVIAWHWRGTLISGTGGIAVAVRDPAGAISAPVDLAPAPGSQAVGDTATGNPAVFIDPQGRAVIDWQQGDFQFEEAVRSADGAIGASSVIGNDIVGGEPIIMDGHGNEVLSYEAGPYFESFVRLRHSLGTFGSETMLPGSCFSPSFLVLRAPDVVTTGWTTKTGTVLSDIRPSTSWHRAGHQSHRRGSPAVRRMLSALCTSCAGRRSHA